MLLERETKFAALSLKLGLEGIPERTVRHLITDHAEVTVRTS